MVLYNILYGALCLRYSLLFISKRLLRLHKGGLLILHALLVLKQQHLRAGKLYLILIYKSLIDLYTFLLPH